MTRIHRVSPPQGKFSFHELHGRDIELIRRLRNDNLGVLRQKQAITPSEQRDYFRQMRSTRRQRTSLYTSMRGPKREWLGYGALVHIDWLRLQCEISSLLLSEFQQTRSWLEFRTEFTLLHETLLTRAREVGMRTVYAELFPSRNYLQPLLSDLGFATTPARPHFYENFREREGIVMEFKIR